MENILELALKSADEAEVYKFDSEEIPVSFNANHLKTVQSKQSTSISLRIIKNGKLGYAAASGEIDANKLVDTAIETSQFGINAKFNFPYFTEFPSVNIYDNAVIETQMSEMIEIGHGLIDPLIKNTPGLLCDAGVSKSTCKLKVINSGGSRAEYDKTIFGIGVGGTLIRDTDMLFVGDGQESCHPIKDIKPIVDTVIEQLEYARNSASVSTKQMDVIFTPEGVGSAFVPSLISAFSGKTVLQGASPIGKNLGEEIFDESLSLYDDPLIDYAANSRPCDDEGVPSRKTPLIENGVVCNFLYDLQTAGLAGKASTGNAHRIRGGLVAPSPSTFVFNTGKSNLKDMISNIEEGLIIEQLMGAEQGNIMGGDFSGNVLLGYKIENGKIIGRVKNTMIAGNVYKILKDIAAMSKEGKWVDGYLYTPYIFCHNISVASKA
jgi:PmbA protein